uniref:Uncharacterized protein n=1 Tax=Anguilla anguilla TaxID=7936 RepID=A0A0E9SSP6_ANGAN
MHPHIPPPKANLPAIRTI